MSLADRRLFFFIEPSFVACGSPGADDPTRTRHLLLRREVHAAQKMQEARVGEYESRGLPIEGVNLMGACVAGQKRGVVRSQAQTRDETGLFAGGFSSRRRARSSGRECALA